MIQWHTVVQFFGGFVVVELFLIVHVLYQLQPAKNLLLQEECQMDDLMGWYAFYAWTALVYVVLVGMSGISLLCKRIFDAKQLMVVALAFRMCLILVLNIWFAALSVSWAMDVSEHPWVVCSRIANNRNHPWLMAGIFAVESVLWTSICVISWGMSMEQLFQDSLDVTPHRNLDPPAEVQLTRTV
jgi:hypothetical protein